MECLVAPPLPDPISESCVSPQLQADVKAYSEETWRESADHVERWLRVLQTFSGTANDSTVMTPAEAQSYADNGWPRWPPVVAALQCLEIEALHTQVEVEDETAPMPQAQPDPQPQPDDSPQPLQAEETPMPQSDSAGFTNFRVYIHDATPNPNSGTEYRISEDDHWEAELIVHFESNESATLNGELCVNHDLWSGNEYWNNGPITLSGFNEYVDRKSSPTWDSIKGVSPQYGYWQCTPNVETEPNITILNPVDDGDDDDTDNDDGIVEFIYRSKIRIRDNNVVEDDFRVSDLQFRIGDALTGSTIWRTETDPVVDRSWWRMLENEVAWAGSWALGTGSEWVDFTNPTCGEVAPSKFIDRAPANRDKTHADYIVRANVSADTWLPDHCFPTKQVPKIPPTPPNTQPTTYDNTSLPIIEDDDVSRIYLYKKNGKWTVKVSRPVMVTDGDPWIQSSEGMIFHVSYRRDDTSSTLNSTDLLIPATGGIVPDGDFDLNSLASVHENSGALVRKNGTDVDTWGEVCADLATRSFGTRDFLLEADPDTTYVGNGLSLTSHPNFRNGSLVLELPPNQSSLCK